MKSVEFLAEAEQNVAKKKIDQQLDSLSNDEIDALLAMINKSIDESRFTYDPLKAAAPGQNKAPAPKSPQPQKSQTTPAAKPQQKKSEVKTYVDTLDDKEKETLKAVLQKEKEEREQTGEKVTASPKSSTVMKGLLKLVLALVIGVGVGQYVGNKVGDNLKGTQTQTQQKEKSTEDKLQDVAWKITRMYKQSAFDEDSLKFRNWKAHLVPNDSGGGHIIISGEVNGKNRFGAYTGYKQFAASVDPDNMSNIQKFYTEDSKEFPLVIALIQSNKGTKSYPIKGYSGKI